VEIPDLTADFNVAKLLASVDVQKYEMKSAVDEFLASSHITDSLQRSPDSIIAGGQYNELVLMDLF
jgi:hypothetical protein